MIIAPQTQRSPRQASEVEESLRLLMEFIDLSRDLERNREDSVFRDASKEIIYVFDENVFEIFFQPKEKRHLVRSFHSPRFAGNDRPDQHWRSFEAQVSLITSEYLLSGSLPGAKRPFVYMTPWHRQELASRIDELSNELAVSARDNIDKATAELALKLQAMQVIEGASEQSWEWAKGEDHWLDRDLDELRRSRPTEDGLRRFALTRIAAGILASNEIHEPIDQLRRSVTPPLSGRYRSFHLDFRANDSERKEITEDAHTWYRLLMKERENAHQRGRPGSDRTDGSLWFDAQALALVRWAATKRARDDQRIVFVTGDGILFNAYRRWYVQNSLNNLSYGENFLLRRLPQYSPMFNISDSENDISRDDSENDISRDKVLEENRRIFGLINEILEVALLPFNLARLADVRDQARDMVITRGREYLVMKMLDATRLSDDDTLTFFMRGETALTQMLPLMWYVLDQLRNTERMAIGAFFPYISQRMSEEHRKIAERLTLGGQVASAEILRAYLTDELDRLLIDSLRGWLSVALESVRHFAFDGTGLPRRIPLTVWYPVREGVDVTDVIEQWRTDSSAVGWEQLVKDIEDRPQAVFVVASTLALISNDWSNGVRFAELAVRAGSGVRAPSVRSSWRREAEFLAVLARRFHLGNYAAHIPGRGGSSGRSGAQTDLSQRSVEESYKRFTIAKTRIGNLIVEHSTKVHDGSEDEAGSEFQQILVMRGRSERAALCLFMAANLIASLETTELRWQAEVALKLIKEADEDIEACWKNEGRISGRHAKHLDRLQHQYIPNAAAAEVLRYLAEEKPTVVDARRAAQVSRIRQFLDANRNLLPLLRAELSFFLILVGVDDDRTRRALREAVEGKPVPPLALDRWLLERIRDSARALVRAG